MQASTEKTHTLTFDEGERIVLARDLDELLDGDGDDDEARSRVYSLLATLRKMG